MNNKQVLKYIDQNTLPFHFCSGCGHGTVLDHLNSALEELQLDPRNIVIVTDIGCSGLSDQYFITNTFHGLHGRSVTYATGIKLANPTLNLIVLMGDGGCGIGGHHLISAARRNVGITVIVFNNLNFGMTGGQHSVTTPFGANTSTTINGNIEFPMNICATVVANGASFVARTSTFDDGLSKLIVEAIKNPGFSLVDVWELCTAYYAPKNKYNKQVMDNTMNSLNFKQGLIHQEGRDEFSAAYRKNALKQERLDSLGHNPLESIYKSKVTGRMDCVIAGDAGMRIGTAASAFSRGAILSGLWAEQRNNYPVTVRSGYSISEVALSSEEILFPGASNPNLMVVLFPNGLEKVKSKISVLTEEATLFISVDLLPVKTRAKVVSMDFRKTGMKREYWALIAIAELLKQTGLYPLDALKAAIDMKVQSQERTIDAINNSDKIVVDYSG